MKKFSGAVPNPKFTVCLVALAICFAAPAVRAEQWAGLLQDVLQYLKMDEAHLRDALHAGEILYTGMPDHEVLPEQLSVAGTLMLVQHRDAQSVVDAFIHSESLLEHARAETLVSFVEARPIQFESVVLPRDELTLLASSRARERFNLSSAEAAALRNAGPERMAAYRKLLYQRSVDYYQNGLEGLSPYERARSTDDPARELRAALDDITFLRRHFPTMHAALLARPAAQPAGVEQVFLLNQLQIADRPAYMLSRQIFEVQGPWGIGADLQFYSAHTLNTGLVIMAVVPYAERSLVFALLHLFTDELLGFGSSMKKKVGRVRAIEFMSTHFRNVRRDLEAAVRQDQ